MPKKPNRSEGSIQQRREYSRIRARAYRETHPEEAKEKQRRYAASEKGKATAARYRKAQGPGRSMQYHRGYRAEMILAYGSRCACCGESEAMFLTLDHINGGGNIERREIGCPMSIILRLRRLGWPKENHQLLCWNCNHGERMGGCPHKRQQ